MSEHTDKLAARVLGAVQDYLRRSLAPLLEWRKAVDTRLAFIPAGATWESLKGEKGEDGRSVPPAEIAELVKAAVAEIPAPRDGHDADPEEVKALVQSTVQAAVAALPPARDGKDADPAVVKQFVDAAVAALPVPKDGRDGKDADPAEVQRLVDGAVAKIPPPAAGKDGQDGQDGRDALEIEILEGIAPLKRYQRGTYASARGGVWKAVRPTDPLPDGGDPFAAGWTCVWCGIHEVAVEHSDDLRKAVFGIRLTNGTLVTKHLQQPVVIDRGVFDPERRGYDAGDGVTWDGSFWIAQRAVALGERPGDTSGAFRMAVKKGRDGRDGLRGEPGKAGRDGKDR